MEKGKSVTTEALDQIMANARRSRVLDGMDESKRPPADFLASIGLGPPEPTEDGGKET